MIKRNVSRFNLDIKFWFLCALQIMKKDRRESSPVDPTNPKRSLEIKNNSSARVF